jgi:hypothetical protein
LSRPNGSAGKAGLGCLLAIGVLLVASSSAHAASQTWDGGCGSDTSWSCAGNWSDNVVPGAEDTLTFNATSTHDSTVDAGFAGTVAALNVNTGYTGTISLARALDVSKAFTQKAGNFHAGAQTLALKALTLSGGDFSASSGTTSVSSTFKVAGAPTFDANGGTVEFGGGSGALTCGGIAFSNVKLSNTTGTKTVGSGCNLPLGHDPSANSGGSIKLNGTLSGTGTLTTAGTMTLGVTGGLSGFSGLATSTLSVVGAYDFGAYSTFTVAKTFKLPAGSSFVAPSGTASFAGSFTISAEASFGANGGTLAFTGAASSNLSCGNKAFHLIVFEHTGGRKTVGADCSLPLGTDPTLGEGSASITLNGSLSGTGTLTSRQTFIMNGASSLSGFSGLVAQSGLTVSGTSTNLGSYSTFAVQGNYVQTGGVVTIPAGADVTGQFSLKSGSTFNAPPAGSVSFANNFTIGAGAVFNAGKGTVIFDGGHSATIACGSTVFNRVVFSSTAGTKIVGSSCTLPLGESPSAVGGGSITLSGTLSGSGTLTTSGTLTLAGGGQLSGFSGLNAAGLTVSGSYNFGSYGSFAVGGAFALNAGGHFTAPSGEAVFDGNFTSSPTSTFSPNGGTVVLAGTEQTVSGSTSFDNLTKVVSSGDTLTFGAGDTQTVHGALTLVGKDAGDLLSLASTAPGTPWLVDREGAAEVAFVSVSDSTNSGATITAEESVDGGGNTGWIFPGPASEFVVAAATTTPKAGEADNLTITARDSLGNTATSYSGAHNLTFGPLSDSPSGAHATVSDSSGTPTNFGAATAIAFSEGIATVSGAKNGQMTLVKAGSASITVSDGSISNGAGLAVTVSPGAAGSLTLAAATTTPKAGEADNLTITARDSLGNTATSYSGAHNLTFGPLSDSPSGAHATVSDSSGTPTNFGAATAIAFSEGIATVSGAKNGQMTLVKAGSASITVSDGSISNGAGLAVTVSPGAAGRIAWANATSNGTLSSPCLFTCTGTGLTSSGNFKANVSITDSSGNRVNSLGSGHTVSVTSSSGTITGGTLTIASSGPAESTTRFTFTPPSKGGASTLTAATASGTVYTSATATMSR